MTYLPTLAHEADAWRSYAPGENVAAPAIRDPDLPLVSIVTPSFNQGAYLAQTIESVLGQDYPNLEYWVIDGGSPDESLEVLARYAHDPRLRWLSERDRGQSDAINKGWARCHGQILAWLNSDDTYLPGAISGQVAALQTNPEAGAVYGDALYTDAAGRPLTRLAGRPYSPLAVLRLEIPVQPTVFLRREIVAQVGPIHLARRYSMDTDYWSRAIKLAPMAQVRATVATYRLHGESKTVAQGAGFYTEWLAIANAFFADPHLPEAVRSGRADVLADLYAVIANQEAATGSPREAMRALAYALTLAGPRPRMLKLPLALLDRTLGLRLGARATEVWGRLTR